MVSFHHFSQHGHLNTRSVISTSLYSLQCWVPLPWWCILAPVSNHLVWRWKLRFLFFVFALLSTSFGFSLVWIDCVWFNFVWMGLGYFVWRLSLFLWLLDSFARFGFMVHLVSLMVWVHSFSWVCSFGLCICLFGWVHSFGLFIWPFIGSFI
jgi:hypothetical protein